MEPLSAHHVFAPAGTPAAEPFPVRPRALIRFYVDYYRTPMAWFGLFVTLLIVAYAGGAIMFTLHSVVLGELGPNISPVEHWALDSTLGFVGLGPVVALIVPLAATGAVRLSGAVRPRHYALIGGILFALAATPGPIAHDLLVGRGTWLANRVTEMLGGSLASAHLHGDSIPQSVSMGAQLIVGVPSYVLLMWASLTLVRAITLPRQQPAPVFE
jgi:hypothetical protein